MPTKISVYIATSLDGYIARPDGSLDWLDQANSEVPPSEDCGYQAFMNKVDVLVMGRNTFEKVLTFGDWPYANKRVVVISSSSVVVPDTLKKMVTTSNEAPRVLFNRLSNEGAKHLYVDGGLTIQRFLQDGLIDEITVTVIPVMLGKGIHLFGSLAKDIWFNHKSTMTYPFGYVQSTYERRS
ncbi:MAG: dihydrofolate reductase [Sideroxydans sp.]|nr:dihydrofolate reductase [Sideroxydans sp.]